MFVELQVSDDSGNYYSINIKAIHNGATVTYVPSNEILIGTALCTYTVDISGGYMRLRVTSVSAANTYYKYSMNALRV
jgi:hypothetical protein